MHEVVFWKLSCMSGRMRASLAIWAAAAVSTVARTPSPDKVWCCRVGAVDEHELHNHSASPRVLNIFLLVLGLHLVELELEASGIGSSFALGQEVST